MRPTSRLPKRSSQQAAALIIVLAFVVLLTGLAVAYLSVATTDRQLAHSSFHDTDADLLARSASDIVVGDFKQEIVNGSTKTSVGGTTVYVPKDTGSGPAANMIPQRSSQIAAGVPNLIRRSVRSDLFSGNPAPPSRASAVNSQDNPSANNRSISSTRWNGHYLVPKGNTTTNDSSPIPAFTNATPDWVLVKAYDPVTQASPGPTVVPSPDPLVIGRYAYAVYDEGGLLDMNVAGYPTGTNIYQYGRKGSLAFADLTAPSPYPIPNPNTDNPPVYQVDRLVGWRNYGTTQPTNNFPDSSPASQAFARNFQTSTASATWFYNFVVNNTSGFLSVRSDPSPTPYPWNYLNVTGDSSPAAYPWNGRTDQNLIQRQALTAYRKTTQFSANALGYLSTFSREAAAGAPQYSPATPTAINPNFQTLVVTGAFQRNDGTTAGVGDPLVNKRFLLERLNWLTYRGPSATRTMPGSAPPLGDPNYDMWLVTSRFGLTSTFLQQGTDLSQPGQTGSTANIYKYFGLVWDATNERWNYIGHPNSPSVTSPLAASIATFGPGGTQGATREPDFFELLQAGILSSSLGDAFSSDPALPSGHQQSTMLHILTIGANLIAQSRMDSYPVRIACNIGGITMEAIGMPRLPCINSLAACPIGAIGLTGGVNWLLIPNLWDPFRDTWDLTEANASNTNLTPGYLRPQVRITIQGTITCAAADSSQSGSVDPMIFSLQLFTPSVSFNSSLTLNIGNNAFGRDGLLNAVRLGTNDISSTPTLLNPTDSLPALQLFPVTQWYSVHPPMNDNSTYRGTPADDYVVFGVRLPGVMILPTNVVFGLKPVLILRPGFQVSLDYQSPNGNWYSYSFLQGLNDNANPHVTWITAGARGPLTIGTGYSEYGLNLSLYPSPSLLPTAINLGTVLHIGTPTPWDDVTGAAAHAPMFAKADPRSIRYNSMIGAINVTSPPLSFNSAGVIGPIWPGPYMTPPPMSPSAFPAPTPTPNPNPATLGDNVLAGNAGNPYSETSGDAWRPVMMNRPFRSVGEMGYAFRDQPFKTLSFSSTNSPDAALLDLFSVNDYSAPSSMRAGTISLNSQQPAALAAVLGSTIKREDTPRVGSPGAPTPLPLSTPDANNTAASLASLSSTAPVTNKGGVATLIANVPNSTGLGPSQPKTQRESIARALGEVDQTRTWNLLIDVIAQTGHFKPNATSLQNDFLVEGEQHYWVHVAIDRFTGQVIDKQIEVVKE